MWVGVNECTVYNCPSNTVCIICIILIITLSVKIKIKICLLGQL